MEYNNETFTFDSVLENEGDNDLAVQRMLNTLSNCNDNSLVHLIANNYTSSALSKISFYHLLILLTLQLSLKQPFQLVLERCQVLFDE